MEDRRRHSIWQRTAHETPASELELAADLRCDVAVVGAGITGLTLAERLLDQGLDVVVLERLRIGGGTTGQTTAHLSSWFDVGLHRLVDLHGYEVGHLVVHALQHSIAEIDQRAKRVAPGSAVCGIDAFVYAELSEQLDELHREFEAARLLGMPVAWHQRAPLPMEQHGAFSLAGQGRLEPLAYCHGLARELALRGCRFLIGAEVEDYHLHGDRVEIEHSAGRCVADRLALATHVPLGRHLVQSAAEPQMSYALALRVGDQLPDALYYDLAEPYHYLRWHQLDGERCLIVGGADRHPGESAEEAYQQLRSYARRRFEVQEELASWSGMWFEPSDALPFIGSDASQRLWFATGFGGDGMTWGTLAAEIIAEGIAGRPHRLAQPLRPLRLSAAGTKQFLHQSLHVARHLLRARIEDHPQHADSPLARGSGAIIRHHGRQLAIARDEAGELHCFDATCPHMGCVVGYDDGDRCFECPCHGSRFALDGSVLEGPSRKPLSPLDLDLNPPESLAG